VTLVKPRLYLKICADAYQRYSWAGSKTKDDFAIAAQTYLSTVSAHSMEKEVSQYRTRACEAQCVGSWLYIWEGQGK